MSPLNTTSATVTVTVISSVVLPSAAVTAIVTVFSPVTRSVFPEIVNVANGSLVTGTTVTARVPAGTLTSPPVASSPATVRLVRDVSELAATLKYSLYVRTEPSWAVTFTRTTLRPVTRASAPRISTDEVADVASAVTSTEVVPYSRSNESPSSTSLPSYWNTARLASSS